MGPGSTSTQKRERSGNAGRRLRHGCSLAQPDVVEQSSNSIASIIQEADNKSPGGQGCESQVEKTEWILRLGGNTPGSRSKQYRDRVNITTLTASKAEFEQSGNSALQRHTLSQQTRNAVSIEIDVTAVARQ
jgi:hypothetical protein